MKSPTIRCVVLDFDGTLTDVDAEARHYLASYTYSLGELLRRDVSSEWERTQKHVLDNADRYGWEFGGKIVAPAHADPYILSGAVARLVLDELGVLQDPKERQAALDGLFRKHYGTTETTFRPELLDFLAALKAWGGPVFVVTNSAPDAVKKKLASLESADASALDVRGNAKKFALEPPTTPSARYDALPAERTIDNLARPVQLKRGRYLEALEAIWRDTGVSPENTLICGDIFEMDLAMPNELGAFAYLVTRPGTRPWEKRGAQMLGRGAEGASLLGALTLLEGAQRAG